MKFCRTFLIHCEFEKQNNNLIEKTCAWHYLLALTNTYIDPCKQKISSYNNNKKGRNKNGKYPIFITHLSFPHPLQTICPFRWYICTVIKINITSPCIQLFFSQFDIPVSPTPQLTRKSVVVDTVRQTMKLI